MQPQLCRVTSFVLLSGSLMLGQQPNGSTGGLVFNGIDGPPYPVVSVNVPRGVVSTAVVVGLPNAPFMVGGSANVRTGGLPYLGGLIDLDMVGFSVAVNGFTNSIWTVDGTGVMNVPFNISQTAPLNQSRAFQGAVSDFTIASGVRLTAATRLVVVPGVTTSTITVSGDSFAAFSFTPYGFTIPFYSQSYSSVYVSANGFLSFGSGDTNYIPDSSSFISGVPRIAAFWNDLSPENGGTIQMRVDQTTPLPFITCQFTNVAEYISGIPHTFSMTVYSLVGDIELVNSGFQPQSLIPTVVGITAGSNLGTQPSRDLSSLNIANYPLGGLIGSANENFHQYFPVPPGMPIWDLAGRTITCTAIGAGAPGASYRVLCTP